MTNRAFKLTHLALALGVAGLLSFGVPIVADWLAPDEGVVPEAQAQESGHSSGGHTSGGGESGASGGHSGGGGSGHAGGGGPPPGKGPGASHGGGHTGGDSGHTSGGHESGGGKGKGGPQYGKSTHGAGEKHSGHVSGQHGGGHESGADRHFGGGSGLHGLGGVPEGVGHGRGAGRRYWGGWVIPDDDDGGGTPTQYAEDISIFYVNPGPGGGGASKAANLSGSFRCSDVGAKASQVARFSKANMERGHEVQRLLNSDATAPDDEYREHALLANFQEEMLKPSPDPATVGTYLGIIAHTEVTPVLVNHVCFHMCVPSADTAFVAEVAANANTVRLALQ